jgi:hypothetical protein
MECTAKGNQPVGMRAHTQKYGALQTLTNLLTLFDLKPPLLRLPPSELLATSAA